MAKKEEQRHRKDVDPAIRRANLSFLQLIFPSFLLVLIPATINGSWLYPLIIKFLVFGYQYFLIQQFVNSIYD